MSTEIDELQIKIEAESKSAEASLDLLVKRLDKLCNSLGRIGGDNSRRAVSSIDLLGNALNKAGKVDGSNLEKLNSTIRKLSKLDSEAIRTAANSVFMFSNQVGGLTSIEKPAESLAVFASSISKLGGKNAQQAIITIPQLSGALNLLMTELSKAPKVNKNLISMTNALASLASNGKKAGTASRALTTSLAKTNQALSKTSKNANNTAASFGRMYLSFYTVIRGLRALYGSFEDAMDLAETVNYFEVTLDNIGKDAVKTWNGMGYDSAEAYAESFAKSLRENTEKLTGLSLSETGQIGFSKYEGLGLSPGMVTQYSAMFAQVANSIGMTEKASVALSETFVRLGADWASLRNMDFEAVYEKLASAMSGQSRALRTLGVDISLARLQEEAYKHGITKTVAEMTQAEKTYLRLISIVEQSEVAYGDLANTISLPANSIRLLKQGLENFSTLMGTLFMPMLHKALPVMNGFVIALNRILVSIAEMMGINTEEINPSVGGLEEGFGGLEEDIEGATDAANKFNKAVRGWDELHIIGSGLENQVGNIAGNVELETAFYNSIEKYRKAWDDAYEKINNEAEDFADGLLKTLNVKKIVDNFTDLADSIGNISDALLPLLGGVASGFGETTFGAFKALADFAGDITENADPATMKSVGESFGTIIANLLLYKGASNITTKFISGIKGIGATLKAHPILGTFALSTGIIQLLELPQKIRKAKAEEFYSDMADETIETSKALDELAREAQKAKEEILNMSGSSELENAFKKWSELALKSEQLTDSEKVMLKAYEERLIEVLPSARQLIEDNVGAYDSVIGKVKELMKTEQLRLKMLSYEDYLSMSLGLEVGFERELEEAKQEFSDVEKQIKDMFSDIPEFELKQIMDAYSKIDKLEFLGKSPSITIMDIFGDYKSFNLYDYFNKSILKSESWKEVGQQLLGTYGKEEAERAKELFELYEDRYSNIQSAESELKRQKEETKWATEQVTKAQNEYNEKVNGGVDATKNLSSALLGAIPKVEELKKQLEKFNGKKYTAELEVKSKFDVYEFYKSLGLKIPTIKLPKFSAGGFPEDGLFMANHSELVGKFSNGKTAVANNAQITQGIEEAAYRGMMRALSSVDMGSKVTFDVKGDPNGIFKVTQQKAREYTKATGLKAYG